MNTLHPKSTSATLALALALCNTGCEPDRPPLREPAPEPAAPQPPPAAEPEVPPLPAVPAGASISFGTPADGAEIVAPLGSDGTVAVAVTMLAEGLQVVPAGTVVAGSGHHHIIIDAPPVAAGEAVPADEQHKHFGKGQTETTLNLKPGEHLLTMQFADGLHRAYGPALSASIKVRVMGNGVADDSAPAAAAPAAAAPAAAATAAAKPAAAEGP